MPKFDARHALYAAVIVAGTAAGAMLPPEQIFPAVRGWLHLSHPAVLPPPPVASATLPPVAPAISDPAVEAGRVNAQGGRR